MPRLISVGAAKCYCSTVTRNDSQRFSCISRRGLCMSTHYCLRGSKIVADQCEDVMEELLLVSSLKFFLLNIFEENSFQRKSSQLLPSED